jgi:hypothetical protein
VKQFGIESRIPCVKFCEAVPAEATAVTPAAAEFLSGLRSNQQAD